VLHPQIFVCIGRSHNHLLPSFICGRRPRNNYLTSTMPSNAYPPLFANTANDEGAPPVVLGYIGASITVLVSAIRLGLTLKKQHELHNDDYAFIVGAVRFHMPIPTECVC